MATGLGCGLTVHGVLVLRVCRRGGGLAQDGAAHGASGFVCWPGRFSATGPRRAGCCRVTMSWTGQSAGTGGRLTAYGVLRAGFWRWAWVLGRCFTGRATGALGGAGARVVRPGFVDCGSRARNRGLGAAQADDGGVGGVLTVHGVLRWFLALCAGRWAWVLGRCFARRAAGAGAGAGLGPFWAVGARGVRPPFVDWFSFARDRVLAPHRRVAWAWVARSRRMGCSL